MFVFTEYFYILTPHPPPPVFFPIFQVIFRFASSRGGSIRLVAMVLKMCHYSHFSGAVRAGQNSSR